MEGQGGAEGGDEGGEAKGGGSGGARGSCGGVGGGAGEGDEACEEEVPLQLLTDGREAQARHDKYALSIQV